MAAAGKKDGICKDCKSDVGTMQCTEGCGLLCTDCDKLAHKEGATANHRRLPRVFNQTMAEEAEAQKKEEAEKAAKLKAEINAAASAAAAPSAAGGGGGGGKPATGGGAAAAAANAGGASVAPILKEGFLTKEGRIIKSWKKRWFVLRANQLEYYSDDKKSKGSLQGEMRLEDAQVMKLPVAKPLGRGKEHALSIDVKGRTLYLAAGSENEQNEWGLALARAATNGTLDGTLPPVA